jgi:hypothetical protein
LRKQQKHEGHSQLYSPSPLKKIIKPKKDFLNKIFTWKVPSFTQRKRASLSLKRKSHREKSVQTGLAMFPLV